MNLSAHRSLLAGTAVGALLLTAGLAQAGSFAIREQSPTAQGEAFAGVAAGAGGLSAMFWNPATMTKNPGWQSQWGASLILPYAQITVDPASPTAVFGGTSNIGRTAVLPSSYSTYQWNDSLWIGLSTNTPFGLATKAPVNWAAQTYGRTSEVVSFGITPTIAYKLNDMLSFGVGVQALYFKTRLTSALGVAPGAAGAELKGDRWGIGFTAGLTFTPFAGTELGIGYRSQVRENLKGTFINGAAAGPLPPAAAIGGAYSISSNLTLPDMVTVGLRQRVDDRWTALAGFEWTHWNVFGAFPVCITAPAPFPALAGCNGLPALAFRYRNGWYASLGAEYRLDPNITLRGGLAYEKSPITIANRGVRLPDNDRTWATIGLGYKYNEKISFDVSYAHAFIRKGAININAASPGFNGLPFIGTANSRLDILSVALNYRWDDPKVAAPIFAKH